MKPRSNEEIAAQRLAAERRKRRADMRMWQAVDLPAEREREKFAERLDAVRDVDPSAAAALEQWRTWRTLVLEADNTDEAELARACKIRDRYHTQWVVLAATHPRLRSFVTASEREAFKDELDSEMARAREAWLRADERLRELRAQRRRGERVSDAQLYEADAVRELALARCDLERDAARYRQADSRREAAKRKGVAPRLSESERQRLKWRADLERFLAAKTAEAIKAGMHPDAVKRLGGAR